MAIGRYGRGIILLGLAAWLSGGLAGCGTSNIFASLNPTPPVPHAKPPKHEPEFTPAALREHQRILATYGGEYNDPRLQKYVKQTVDRLVAASERPSQHYHVTLLNSANINAFALPNGQLYVTRGLLALADDRAELASVLSHEMAHVIAHHAEIRANQAKQAAIVSRVVSDVLTDPEVGALALAKSKIALATFSRAQEFEADGIGVGISARAGFDPYGAERFLLALQRNAELRAGAGNTDPYAMDFLSTHPATPVRIQNVIANARQYAAPGTSGERDHNAYLAQIDGITYGEDPTGGFVRGRRYEHPKLGFTFTAPPGFTLDNTAQAVLGVGESGTQALRLDVVHVPPQQSLAQYLNSGWIENIEKDSIETTTINGFEAATAKAKGEQWSFRLYAIRFGPDVYRFVYATQRAGADIDAIFRDSVSTFRRMTTAEIENARPLRIKLVTVRAGDTQERMARHMTGVDRPLDRFRLINGLDAGQPLRPGERVKIVTE